VAARQVADAVLYEGYLLYPYRRSSGKNRIRWQFGVLPPRSWIEPRTDRDPGVAGSAESWFQQTEVLVEPGRHTVLHIRVRFLQLQVREVQSARADGSFQLVDSLVVQGREHLAFEEAVERSVDAIAPLDELLASERTVPFDVGGGEDVETLTDDDGRSSGRLIRRRWPISLVVRIDAERARAPFPLVRLRIRTENALQAFDPGAARREALLRSPVGAHTFVAVTGGAFVSLLEPPAWAATAATTRENLHTFPVLAGQPGSRELMLSSPIILYDHPRVAPESPGDLFDASEIDEILSLRTLTLTEEEKQEARATDRRAAALVDRVDSMPPQVLQRLHGAIRSLRPRGVQEPDNPQPMAWWSPEADASVAPWSDAVQIDGVAVTRGSRVRLRPERGRSDAHDMFLLGRAAVVEGVFLDVDGATHLAVTLEDDPAAELHQWYGRYFYFSPDEVEPLVEGSAR
jgi:hypothetical protein